MTLAVLQQDLDGLVQKGVPGAFVYIEDASGCSAFLTAGYADIKRKTRMRPSDYFHACSITKSFTATVLLQLVAEKVLKLEDTVAQCLPEWKIPSAQMLTLEHLLRMRSGLADFEEHVRLGDSLENHQRPISPETCIELALERSSRFKPNKKYDYCNTNYVLLELIIEKATGSPLAQHLGARLFDPLGLRTTHYPHWADLSLPEPYIRGYESAKSNWLECSEIFMGRADGALLSSALDLARFFRALLGGALLPKRLLKHMLTIVPDKPTARRRYGLGIYPLATSVGEVWGHTGGGYGYESLAFLHPSSGRFVATVVNTTIYSRSDDIVNTVNTLHGRAFEVSL
jgi:D-alanyl-D-alanine carboxypeptidase